MASAIPQQPPASLETRPYFCHQCSHQWMKSANSLFQCPRCNEGFIEEVTADFQPRPPSPASPDIPINIISFLNEVSMLTDEFRGRSATERPTARRRTDTVPPASEAPRGASTSARRRQPRMSLGRGLAVVFGDSESREGNAANNDIRIRFGVNPGARGFFTFPIDDVMNTLFAAAAVQQPVMTDAQLQEIPKATITAEDVQGQSQCAICFEDYALNEEDIRKLPCTHLYHEKCIFPWLKNNASCPICRARMPNATEIDDDSDIDDVVMGELSRFMDFPTLARENRNGEPSRANNAANVRQEPARQRSRFQYRTARIGSNLASTSTPVQTRSGRREPQNIVSRRVRPETRAAAAASAVPASNENGRESRNAPSRRNNLRRVPAMMSLVEPPSTSSSASSSSSSPGNDERSERARARTNIAISNLRAAMAERRTRRQENSADAIIDIPAAGPSRSLRQNPTESSNLPSQPELSRRRRHAFVGPASVESSSSRLRTAAEQLRAGQRPRPNRGGVSSVSGISTRTRSRQNRLEDLLTFSSSPSPSNTSLVSISSDEEPPRRRRRLNTTSSSD